MLFLYYSVATLHALYGSQELNRMKCGGIWLKGKTYWLTGSPLELCATIFNVCWNAVDFSPTDTISEQILNFDENCFQMYSQQKTFLMFYLLLEYISLQINELIINHMFSYESSFLFICRFYEFSIGFSFWAKTQSKI